MDYMETDRRLLVEAQTLCRCAQVCREWRALSMGTAAWMGLLQGVGVDWTAERTQRPNELFHLACVDKLKSGKHQGAASSTGAWPYNLPFAHQICR